MKLANQIRLALACAAALPSMTAVAGAGTVDRIKQEQAIRIAYQEDAPPFSYKDKIGEPTGFMVDLCKEVAKKLAEQFNLPSLTVSYVPVTAADRFEAITQQKADLLCEPTSATLSRREQVDFSIATFVDGAGLLVRANGPKGPARHGRTENRRARRHNDRGGIAQHAELRWNRRRRHRG